MEVGARGPNKLDTSRQGCRRPYRATNPKDLCPAGMGLYFFVFTQNFLGLAVDARYDLHDLMYYIDV